MSIEYNNEKEQAINNQKYSLGLISHQAPYTNKVAPAQNDNQKPAKDPANDNIIPSDCPKTKIGVENNPSQTKTISTGYRFDPNIEKQLKKLTVSDNYHGIFAWLGTVSIIATTIFCSIFLLNLVPFYWAPLILLPAWIVIGSRQRALATLLHEASHRTLAKNRRLNDFLGAVLAGWAILQLGVTYKLSHVFEHHPKLGRFDLDPDTEYYVSQGLFETNPHNFVRNNFISMALGYKTIVNLPYLMRHRLFPKDWTNVSRTHKLELCAFCITWTSFIVVLIWMGWIDTFILYWVIPYCTTFQAVNWLIETSEHFPLVGFEDSVIRATRNRDGNAFERFLTGAHGEGWHLVHHLRPRIPFWKMRSAHELMLQDQGYSMSVNRYGGLFTNRSSSRPTILSAMATELAMYQSIQTDLPTLGGQASGENHG